jgi:prevent-host-death family protein
METIRIGAEQFRRELADLLARVAYGGEQVIVERHGTPQAVLISYTLYNELLAKLAGVHAPAMTDEEFVQHLVEKGLVRPRPPRSTTRQHLPERRLIETTGKPLSEVIIEERR